MPLSSDLEERIETESALIKKLEASGPELDLSVAFYDSNNTEWHQHQTQIKDAYWRRRVFRTQLEGGDVDAARRFG